LRFKLRILIVEDNVLLAFMVEECLVEAGHSVIGPVPSVTTALAAIKVAEPDLALIDINLEGEGSGIDLARKLSERAIPIFYATGQVEMARAVAAHAMGVIPKPFSPELIVELVSTIERQAVNDAEARFPRDVELFGSTRRTRG
jgi:two-component system, response regulator PdtaR